MTSIAPPTDLPEPPADAGVLFRQSSGFVAVALRKSLVRWNDIPDLVNDVFLIAHQRFDTFDPAKGTANNWLYGIVRKTAANHRKLFYNRAVVLLGDALSRHAAPSDPERGVITDQEVHAIEDAMANVSDDDLNLVVSAGLEGKAAGELGDERGLSEGAVRNRLYRTRKLVDEKLRRRDALGALRSPVILVLLLLAAAAAIARSAGLRPSDLPTALWPFTPPAPSAAPVPSVAPAPGEWPVRANGLVAPPPPTP